MTKRAVQNVLCLKKSAYKEKGTKTDLRIENSSNRRNKVARLQPIERDLHLFIDGEVRKEKNELKCQRKRDVFAAEQAHRKPKRGKWSWDMEIEEGNWFVCKWLSSMDKESQSRN